MTRLIREQNTSRRVRHLSMKCGPDFERFMFLGAQDSRKRIASMNRVCPFRFCCLLFLMAIATGCSPNSRKTAPPEQVQEAAAPAYQVDPLTAGSISGMIRYIGKRSLPKKIDMNGDPACVEAHHGNALDESLVVSSRGGLANAFVYVKSGLEGKNLCDALNVGCD